VKIIDAHTHAFPDKLAARALETLHEKAAPFRAVLDGTVGGLLESMDSCGIEKSVVCSIATRPEQFNPILDWCEKIRSDRIVPLASIHPDTPEPEEKIREIKRRGLKGLKLHSMYQDFSVDEERLFPIYESIRNEGLVLELHAGYDISYPDSRSAEPSRILKVHKSFPGLILLATHIGGWRSWDEADEFLAGREIYFDTSFTLDEIAPETLSSILSKHGIDRILLGSDSPWRSQQYEIDLVRKLDIGDDEKEKILGLNAERLLSLV